MTLNIASTCIMQQNKGLYIKLCTTCPYHSQFKQASDPTECQVKNINKVMGFLLIGQSVFAFKQVNTHTT